MGTYRDVQEALREPVKDLRSFIPDVWSAFADEHRHVMKEGALSTKSKELIALAIAVVKRCDGCIAAHAKGAHRAGATPEEVAEALSVALMMDGSTVTVYGPRAFEAYREFSKTK
ncbi:MAG: carboxymuconolactone decarboxylase family protein [Acidimicrobiales bacterium]|nr:carboxymuconolactone decarboxylase family protein [Acidimicrobiales bacterium]